MRILFLTQVVPLPLDAGPKVRSYYVLRYLAQAGHEITLLSFGRPEDREEQIEPLRRLCRSVRVLPVNRSRLADISRGLRSVAGRTPFLILRDRVPAMREAVEQALAERSFDAIHADQLWMSPYAQMQHRPALSVLDQHNAVFLVFRRMAQHGRNPFIRLLLDTEATKLEAFEHSTCERFERVIWVTEEDRRALGGGTGRNGSEAVIPIAVDCRARQPLRRRSPFRVTFVGGMHWPPNTEGVLWFAREVWPFIARRAPQAVFTVIGRRPPATVRRLSSQVDATGYVEDPEKYLSETAAFVVPLRSGAGMRVKILDAWCWGLPVVSTSLGAEGLRAAGGENLMLGDSPASFAEAVIQVLSDRECARNLSESGRATVETFYDWPKIYPAWDKIYH